ncbi:hypothetical protein B296_00049058 [Ensete ventricosum]|uniref:Uncharacterized protein n=1 Tax=Ensete ventricosum TaxID=4639 RepID=A0A426YGC4_ENSVE|nr:hypothetical protein B296_00049058 [Ensete ventricosum]
MRPTNVRWVCYVYDSLASPSVVRFGTIVEELARPGPCRVRKLVHVSRGRGQKKSPFGVTGWEDFILISRRVDRMLGLISVDTPSELVVYGESIGAEEPLAAAAKQRSRLHPSTCRMGEGAISTEGSGGADRSRDMRLCMRWQRGREAAV